jgi:hypothetical protein
LSPEETQDFEGRLENVGRVGALFTQLRATFQRQFGGGYTDQARGGIVVLQIVGDEPAGFAEAVESADLLFGYELVSATTPEVDLVEGYSRLMQSWDDLRGQGPLDSARIDTYTNSLWIGLKPYSLAPDFEQAVRRTVAPAIDVRFVPSGEEILQNAPYGGDGATMYPPGEPASSCSWGFTLNNGRVLTAGHCRSLEAVHQDPPTFHWHGLPFAVEYWPNGGTTDAQTHSPNGAVAARVWDGWNGHYRRVIARSSLLNWWDNVGDPVCVSARTSRNCGFISARGVSTTYAGKTTHDMRCAFYGYTYPGDSGGAVWGPHPDGVTTTAVGLHRGIGANCPVNGIHIYTHMHHVVAVTGNEVLIEP